MSDEFKAVIREKIYAKALDEAKKMIAEHEAEVESYREQGYRPHYCIHGTNHWTDYDNICWGCEESIFEPEQFAEMWTPDRVEIVWKALSAWQNAYGDRDVPDYVTDALYKWFGEVCEKYYPSEVNA